MNPDEPIQLFNGDCLELMKAIPDGSVDMVLCDLPYGFTNNRWDKVLPLDALWAQYRRVCKPNAAVVLTAAQPFASALVQSNPKQFKYEWIWRKPYGTGFLNAKIQPLRNHEHVLVFYRQQPVYNPQMRPGKPYVTKRRGRESLNYRHFAASVTENLTGDRYPVTVLDFNYDRDKVHPTQKPVALLEYLIRTYTNPGDLVLDNTMGSGSTGVACRNTGRRFIGIELDTGIYDTACNRLAVAVDAEPVTVEPFVPPYLLRTDVHLQPLAG